MPLMITAPSMSSKWDIFCKVVDNFGDAGVCWRLARMLKREHGLHVRLWIDDLVTLGALEPALNTALPVQDIEGITVGCWSASADVAGDAAAVIEAFGCGLPDHYVRRMAESARPPLWIVLEYLSAEPWVDAHHGLASPHPQLALTRYFFFPGFTPGTGGLLREADLVARRDAFDAASRRIFWRSLGFDEPRPSTLVVSLFAYAYAPVSELLESIAQGNAPVVLAVPAGAPMPLLRSFFGATDVTAGKAWHRGRLEVRPLPFLTQARYDELLWACDINFVRGEDSFVRAQWAARPLIWQPYRQDDGAHLLKMEAFLVRYGAGMDPAACSVLRRFWRFWNGGDAGEANAAWSRLRTQRAALAAHAGCWARELSDMGQMSAQLVDFVRNKVE